MLQRAIFAVLVAFGARAQSTQGSLIGHIEDSVDGHAVTGAAVECENRDTGQLRHTLADAQGDYSLLSLSPGTYRVRVTASGYQPQELLDLEIQVASANQYPFRLRPAGDVWEQRERRNLRALENRALLPLIGPDLGAGFEVALATSPLGQEGQAPVVSTVVDRAQLTDLPLSGRDAYALLVTLGGVNSDAGSGRGLGLTVSGQRPSAAVFRLDGFENNNQLTTGPGVTLPPEAISEYRVSLAHFTAEYGGTSGFLANAVSREPRRGWHGLIYSYLQNDALDANSFSRNRNAYGRAADRSLEPGILVSGPLLREWSNFSLFFESSRSRSEQDPVIVELPSVAYKSFTAPGGYSRGLLDRFAAPLPASLDLQVPVNFRPDVNFDRVSGMFRAGQTLAGERLHVFERLAVNRLDRPDFLWTPYPDFVTPLRQDDALLGVSASWTPSASVAHEFRVGYAYNRLGWPRPYPDIPTLTGFNFSSADPLVLPGSPAAYGYRDRNRAWETGYNLTLLRGTHEIKLGGQTLWRRGDGALTFGRDGRYVFQDVLNFYLDWPSLFQIAVDRAAVEPRTPTYETHFGSGQYAGFVQDQWRVSPRLLVSVGLRYEFFGPPKLRGGSSVLTVEPGPGDSLSASLASSRLQALSAGDSLYAADRTNFGVRLGASYKFPARGPVFRASYGIFYDRPFDNLWQNLRNNSIQLESVLLDSIGFNFLQPVGRVLTSPLAVRADFPEMLLYQPSIRDPYAHSYFAGFSSTLGEFWQWEANALGSRGRNLITTDRINRPFSVAASDGNPAGRINPDLGTLAYRANQGESDFNGLNLVLRRRSPTTLLQASYTWSHAIDNQSEPLAGDFFDLSFTSTSTSDPLRGVAAFTRQFDARGDRANSDFDQRHNLVLLASWQAPPVFAQRLHGATNGWRLSALATVRSGLPFTVYGPGNSSGSVLYNRTVDYTGAPLHTDSTVDGGLQWLNPAAFTVPAGNRQGNLGRNALRAAGFYSLDASLARQFALPKLPESARLTLRVDAFNLLNHANLDRPQNVLGAPDFGVALLGRHGQTSSMPAAVPLNESPRQLQIGIRIEF
jgi:hypothetical protein